MEQNLPKLNRDLLELIKSIDTYKTEVIEVNASRLVLSGVNANTLAKESYHVCSSCYSFIEQDWNHEDWCKLYKEEKLSEWIRKGKNEK